MSSASGHEVPAGAEAASARRRKPDLTPEEAKIWRLAKLFDLRSFIGALMLIFGILVIIPGFLASPATIDKAAGINLALWVGGIMLALAAFFLTWVILSPPPPVTTAEMEAAGHPVIARIHSFGADGDGAAAYYDTAETLGFLVEAVEPPSQMPPTDFIL